MSHKFNLGDSAKDIVTGFTGICIARFEWLNGCVRYEVQPTKLKDGQPLDAKTFDQGQLVLVKRGAVKIPPNHTGGPMPTPKLPATPQR
ncbi:MAG: hypothetical protein K9G48_13870 [Reyranella sp.]|nr:hypothetical protein [Reyranella sp.]